MTVAQLSHPLQGVQHACAALPCHAETGSCMECGLTFGKGRMAGSWCLLSTHIGAPLEGYALRFARAHSQMQDDPHTSREAWTPPDSILQAVRQAAVYITLVCRAAWHSRTSAAGYSAWSRLVTCQIRGIA